MVSETNESQTVDFFRSHDYFGLDRGLIRFIVQGMNPAIDGNGKILMREKHRLFLNPNGHGGTLSTLRESGSIPWLRERGVEEIFYFQVDNVLINILDPLFIGYHTLNGCDMSSKCVMKRDPAEKIGAFVLENGKTTIVEYTETDAVVVEDGCDRDEALRAGNIAVHVIGLDFVDRVTSGQLHLPLHIAHKAIPHIDEGGERVSPSEPNGYKIETFIFDGLKLADRTIIMEVSRSEEFSPLKNREGEDSIETVLRDQLDLFARWLERANVPVPREADGRPACRIEISPLRAPTEEEFLADAGKPLSIKGDIYVE
jgi:UDP-N-acetylglucosamine/UDP-N-acetylgalactosamine diphosphorylase